MRNVQLGISAMFLVIAILVITVALTAGYFTFYLDLKKTKQSSSEINSFEACAALYPVMESYPEQCNTPNGKHFTRQLSEEEKQKLIIPVETKQQITQSGRWIEYVNDQVGFQFSHPSLESEQVSIWGPETSILVKCFDDKSTVVVGTDAPFDGFCIYVDQNTNNKSLDIYKNELKKALNTAGEKSMGKEDKIIVDGIAGLDLKDFSIFGAKYTVIPWPKSQKFLVIARTNKYENSFEEKYKKILSSFKFLK